MKARPGNILRCTMCKSAVVAGPSYIRFAPNAQQHTPTCQPCSSYNMVTFHDNKRQRWSQRTDGAIYWSFIKAIFHKAQLCCWPQLLSLCPMIEHRFEEDIRRERRKLVKCYIIMRMWWEHTRAHDWGWHTHKTLKTIHHYCGSRVSCNLSLTNLSQILKRHTVAPRWL